MHVLGEAADRDAVDAGLGDGAHALEVDATGGFEFEAGGVPVPEARGAVHEVGGHVVEEDDVNGVRGECEEGLELVKGVDFDLDASLFMVGENGKVQNDDWFIFYNQLHSPCRSVEHTGDNRTVPKRSRRKALNVLYSSVMCRLCAWNFSYYYELAVATGCKLTLVICVCYSPKSAVLK